MNECHCDCGVAVRGAVPSCVSCPPPPAVMHCIVCRVCTLCVCVVLDEVCVLCCAAEGEQRRGEGERKKSKRTRLTSLFVSQQKVQITESNDAHTPVGCSAMREEGDSAARLMLRYTALDSACVSLKRRDVELRMRHLCACIQTPRLSGTESSEEGQGGEAEEGETATHMHSCGTHCR